MPEQRDVKVFISWSGDLAKEVANALRSWLPLLFDRVKPWASDTDIAAGSRSLATIEAELTNTEFGIVVVTAENQRAPWVNFEAGALSKTIPGDVEHRVVPLLVDIGGPSQLTGPLSQFQAKIADAEGMKELLRSLAAVAGIEEFVADERFDTYWPRLQDKIEVAKSKAAEAATKAGQPKEKPRDQAELLDEILLHVRQLRSDAEGGAVTATNDSDEATRNSGIRARFVKWADRFDFDLYEYSRPTKTDIRVTVVPQGKFTEDAFEALTRFLREQVPDSVDLKVDYVPF